MRCDRRVAAVSLFGAWLFSACAHRPPAAVPNVQAFDREVYGGWIVVSYPKSAKRPKTAGELIAVVGDQLSVLTATGAVSIARSDIDTATVVLFSGDLQINSRITGAMVSTLSHGVLLAATIPLWSLTAAATHVAYDRFAEITYPDVAWESLRRGARFPQGLPKGLDPGSLRARPLPKEDERKD